LGAPLGFENRSSAEDGIVSKTPMFPIGRIFDLIPLDLTYPTVLKYKTMRLLFS
jgi:hypothetical protein